MVSLFGGRAYHVSCNPTRPAASLRSLFKPLGIPALAVSNSMPRSMTPGAGAPLGVVRMAAKRAQPWLANSPVCGHKVGSLLTVGVRQPATSSAAAHGMIERKNRIHHFSRSGTTDGFATVTRINPSTAPTVTLKVSRLCGLTDSRFSCTAYQQMLPWRSTRQHTTPSLRRLLQTLL